MSWTATSRYDTAVADGGLALVQDLLNTIPAGRPRHPDLLQDVATAQDWLDSALTGWAEVTGGPAPTTSLDERGLEELQALRSDLRGVVAAADHGDDVVPGTPELRAASIGLALHTDGTVTVEPRGQGWRPVVGQILIEILEAQRADTWRRLKTCRNDRCAVAFYDRSRNNSGAWHDVKICGNAANLRASRARRRVAASVPVTTGADSDRA